MDAESYPSALVWQELRNGPEAIKKLSGVILPTLVNSLKDKREESWENHGSSQV